MADEPAENLAAATKTMLSRTERAALELDVRPTELHAVRAAERSAADSRSADARAAMDAGRLDEAIRIYVEALARNPFDGGARADLVVAVARRERLSESLARSGGRPETREAVIVAFADVIAAEPDLLVRYAEAITGADPVTLVIAIQPGDAEALSRRSRRLPIAPGSTRATPPTCWFTRARAPRCCC